MRYSNTVSPKTEPISQRGLPADGPRICPIADALEIVGERYSLLVLRELGFGVTRFNDIRHNTGAPRETLATRLRKLEADRKSTRLNSSHRISSRMPSSA